MAGKLYVIGVGPGDPELLTLKAVRILEGVKVLCVPKAKEGSDSIALSVVKDVLSLEHKEIMEARFPMKKPGNRENRRTLEAAWRNTVKTITSRLEAGADVAFLTIGDPTLYSTFFHLYDKLLEAHPDLNIEIIPGVSSITAAASRARISLGLADEKIAILPAPYADDLKEILEQFDSVVLMKVHKVIDRVMGLLEEMRLADHATYIAKVGMDDEVICRDIGKVGEEEGHYLSMVIVRK
ncbi:MAG: precorrin-2 C(20)-methyltransferase [Candidatus Latescibacteria bacterium]|nr:precorrin-2 C(20)-methyltransferase [Candidatus Latescibacterota bacterium]